MLKLIDVKIQDHKTKELLFGPLSYEFYEPGLYYVYGRKSQENAFLSLTMRKRTQTEGQITYRDLKLSRYEELNRTYEDMVYENSSLFIPKLSVLDNYLTQLFAIYKSRDYALDVVAPYLDMMPERINADTPYGELDKPARALVDLFSINFNDYRIALLKDPLGEQPPNVSPLTYIRMLEKLRQNMLIILTGKNKFFDEMEHLDVYKSNDINICRIGEMIDEED